MPVKEKILEKLLQINGLSQVENRLREASLLSDKAGASMTVPLIRGGKRLRPALVLLCGSFAPASAERLIDVATAAELIHTASLTHDDVVDQASSRRGKPTISYLHSNSEAVLYGDYLFARAFLLITRHRLTEVLSVMMQAITMMSEGELIQAAHRYDCNWQESDYMNYIYKKTAFFISACCLAGAQISALPSRQQKALAGYGLQLGYAYQLTDDLLDFTGSEQETGKPVGHDLPEGCLTLPVIMLLNQPGYRQQVKEIISSRNFTPASLAVITRALEQEGILSRVKAIAAGKIDQAIGYLQCLPATSSRQLLHEMAEYVIFRSR